MSAKNWTQIIREDDFIKMVIEFLSNRDLCISQLHIERETGESPFFVLVCLPEFSSEFSSLVRVFLNDSQFVNVLQRDFERN